jgi:hypothetical protein
MTRVSKAVAARRARARRDRWARVFRPDKVRLLLIAEAPPSALDRYFYFPIVPRQDSLFREVARALLSVEPTRENKRQLLERLKGEGVFLIDAVPEPMAGQNRIDIGRLIGRVRRLEPTKVIVVKTSVFDRIFEPLRDAGIPVVPIRIPFPGSGQQIRFRQAFKLARRRQVRSGASAGPGKDEIARA